MFWKVINVPRAASLSVSVRTFLFCVNKDFNLRSGYIKIITSEWQTAGQLRCMKSKILIIFSMLLWETFGNQTNATAFMAFWERNWFNESSEINLNFNVLFEGSLNIWLIDTSGTSAHSNISFCSDGRASEADKDKRERHAPC